MNKLPSKVEQIQNLSKRLAILASDPVVKDYLAFMALPSRNCHSIWEGWNKYYEEVKNTISYAIWQSAGEAARKNDIGRVIDLSKQAAQMRSNGETNTIKKPFERDPFDYSHTSQVLAYKMILEEKNRLELELRSETTMGF